jgi:hypothetical protein
MALRFGSAMMANEDSTPRIFLHRHITVKAHSWPALFTHLRVLAFGAPTSPLEELLGTPSTYGNACVFRLTEPSCELARLFQNWRAMIDLATVAGLSSTDAVARPANEGPNDLASVGHRTFLRRLRDVACEPLTARLGSGAIYFFLGDRPEALMLLGFVVLVVGITRYQDLARPRSPMAERAA